jgi:uncharacterized protein YjbI with pentapeptide repeats
MSAYLMGVHLIGVYLTGVHLIGVYLKDVYLTGVYLMGMHLTGVHLTGVYPMGVHLVARSKQVYMEWLEATVVSIYLPEEKRTFICTLDPHCCLRPPCHLGPAQLNPPATPV